jgi:hypothetical protein
MNVVVTPTPPVPPTIDELRATRDRYLRRIPAQDERVALADRAVQDAERALAAAAAELTAAMAARKTLDTYIADLTAQIGA